MINNYWTGIGSRSTPGSVCDLMTETATRLEDEGYILRSGGADGADYAFELGVKEYNNKEIYLPWIRFNDNPSSLVVDMNGPAPYFASQIHPAWDNLTRGPKALHARNVHQVLGKYLIEPSKFLICWTEGGKVVGGTATAINLAKCFRIPVFNLGSPKAEGLTSEEIVSKILNNV